MCVGCWQLVHQQCLRFWYHIFHHHTNSHHYHDHHLQQFLTYVVVSMNYDTKCIWRVHSFTSHSAPFSPLSNLQLVVVTVMLQMCHLSLCSALQPHNTLPEFSFFLQSVYFVILFNSPKLIHPLSFDSSFSVVGVHAVQHNDVVSWFVAILAIKYIFQFVWNAFACVCKSIQAQNLMAV